MSENLSAATPESETAQSAIETCLTVNQLSLFYGDSQALTDINLGIATKQVTALSGRPGAVNLHYCDVSIA